MRTTIEMNGILTRKANDDHFVSTSVHIIDKSRNGVPKHGALFLGLLWMRWQLDYLVFTKLLRTCFKLEIETLLNQFIAEETQKK